MQKQKGEEMPSKDVNPSPSTAPLSPQGKSWIEKTPEVCDGDACIRDTRHNVWGLVEWRKLGLTDEEILRHFPDLNQADLDVAWDYYQRNPQEIEQAIKENEEA
jgi:uncharacterized protein (DUF433 family)